MLRRDLLHVLGAATLPMLAPLPPEARLGLGRRLHERVGHTTTLRALSARQGALVALLGEMILPATDTPGASDVRTAQFIDLILAEWHTPEEREGVLTGLDAIDTRARTRHGAGLLELRPADRLALVSELDGVRGPRGSAEAAFARVKQLTIYGYFTSERVMREVVETPIIPGRFDGCIPFPVR